MDIKFEELTHDNLDAVRMIDRSDICNSFADDADTIMEITDYGVEHGCIGHTFAVRNESRYIGLILIGEALEWETDPPVMRSEPFYRIMGFVVGREYRRKGIGGEILEKAIQKIYDEFGRRSIALGCHKDNKQAARFYERHNFIKTGYREGNDEYYLRLIKR